MQLTLKYFFLFCGSKYVETRSEFVNMFSRRVNWSKLTSPRAGTRLDHSSYRNGPRGSSQTVTVLTIIYPVQDNWYGLKRLHPKPPPVPPTNNCSPRPLPRAFVVGLRWPPWMREWSSHCHLPAVRSGAYYFSGRLRLINLCRIDCQLHRSFTAVFVSEN